MKSFYRKNFAHNIIYIIILLMYTRIRYLFMYIYVYIYFNPLLESLKNDLTKR